MYESRADEKGILHSLLRILKSPAVFSLFIFIFAAYLVSPCTATDIHVGDGGPDTISEAVLKAVDGDVIYIDGGRYIENIVIDKKISLVGKDSPVIASKGGDYTVLIAEDGILIDGLTIKGSADAGILVKSSFNRIVSNKISGLPVGVRIAGGRGNIVTENDFWNNDKALLIEDSAALQIYLNNFIENDVSAEVQGSVVKFSTDETEYKYNGKSFTGSLGNYWSDYSGKDKDGDGIGDLPYRIQADTASPKGTGKTANTMLASSSKSGRLIADNSPLVAYFQKYDPENGEKIPLLSGNIISVDSPPLYYNLLGVILLLFLPAFGLCALIFRRCAGKSPVMVYSVRKAKVFSLCCFIAGAAVLLSTALCLNVSDIAALFEKSPGILIICFIVSFSGFCSVFTGFSLSSGRINMKCSLMTAAASVVSLALSIALYLISASGILNEYFNFVLGSLFLSSVILLSVVFVCQKSVPVRPDPIMSKSGRDLENITKNDDIQTAGKNVSESIRTRKGGKLSEEGFYSSSAFGASDTAHFPQMLCQRYSDITYVGMGGIARVFKAKRSSDGRTVAVKVPISFDENTGKMFIREMRVWEELDHINIVKLYSFNILPVPFVEMEYIPKSLSDMDFPLEHGDVIKFVRDIASAISYAHKKGIIHRDIKPQNILVTAEGTAKVTDWGLAKLLDDRHESTVGGYSLYYAAPEQLAPDRFGKPDERTDIYQIGVLMYEILVGLRPFAGGGVGDITEQILYQKPMMPSENRPVDSPFDHIIMKCLEKKPADRFSSVEEFLSALDDIESGRKPEISDDDLFR